MTQTKFLIVAFTLFYSSFNVIGQEFQKQERNVQRYANTQQNTIWISNGFGKSALKNSRLTNELKGYQVYHVDLVYTAFKSDPSYNQDSLNDARVLQLMEDYPQLKNDSPNWTYYKQTGATEQFEARKYFHGFVIHYGKKLDYQAQKEYFKKLEVPFQELGIINEEGGILQYSSGSQIEMPKYAVTYMNGDTVRGKYQLYYREFRNQAEIAVSGITMRHGEGKMFNSAGMYEFVAMKDGKQLKLVKAAEVDLMPTADLDQVGFFELDDNHWQELDSKTGRFSSGITMTLKDGTEINQIKMQTEERRVTVSDYRPEEFIDQGEYQGYSHISRQFAIDKNQVFAALSEQAMRKFNVLTSGESRISAMVDEVKIKEKTMLVFRDSLPVYLELIMSEPIEKLDTTMDKTKITYLNSLEYKKSKDLTVTFPGSFGTQKSQLINGLRSFNFGVFNCDQTRRIVDPVALNPTYYNDETGKKLGELYVTCVIDMEINASLSFHPNHLYCNERGNNQLVIFGEGNRVFLLDKTSFKNLDLSNPEVDLAVKDVTDQVKSAKDLATVLGIG
ncbi:hypothetical protein K6119_10425 [Paracrocinitomix mangrovi]|uniref:hypothetical protein n=1 Tax=Paracrocinitomix mangrovi TaxID=2862509 RepID=UPI001C8F141A|nr:hypothetical protein [Paracrocinitomix mangrovi]UKN00149.1 hypothetical protein K6119_10425 [Paracrocinitomix mangrovi]